MSFSGMQSSVLKRHNDAGGLGWIFGLSMAATASIVMKWWWNHVITQHFKSESPSLVDRPVVYSSNCTGPSTATSHQTENLTESNDVGKISSLVVEEAKDPYQDLSFAEVAAKIREANIDFSTQDQLMLYALYKQATKGDAPLFLFSLSLADQTKHHAWSQFREMPKEIASAQYIQHAVELLKSGGGDSGGASQSQSQSLGTGVSSRPVEPQVIQEQDMTREERVLWAAGNNKVEILLALLEDGANVDQRDEVGQTALHMAADAGAVEALTLLLARGADVLAADQNGISVLQAAVIAGNVQVCRLLLAQGADPDQADHDGDTPRLCAQDDGEKDMRDLFKRTGDRGMHTLKEKETDEDRDEKKGHE